MTAAAAASGGSGSSSAHNKTPRGEVTWFRGRRVREIKDEPSTLRTIASSIPVIKSFVDPYTATYKANPESRGEMRTRLGYTRSQKSMTAYLKANPQLTLYSEGGHQYWIDQRNSSMIFLENGDINKPRFIKLFEGNNRGKNIQSTLEIKRAAKGYIRIWEAIKDQGGEMCHTIVIDPFGKNVWGYNDRPDDSVDISDSCTGKWFTVDDDVWKDVAGLWDENKTESKTDLNEKVDRNEKAGKKPKVEGSDESDDNQSSSRLEAGDTFKLNDGSEHRVISTRGDGACALHALIGKKNESGAYVYDAPRGVTPGAAARGQYVEAFRKGYNQHQEVIDRTLTGLLKDYLSGSPNRYTRMIFDSLPNIKAIREAAAKYATNEAPLKRTQEELFAELVTTKDAALQKALAELTQTPFDTLAQNAETRNVAFRRNMDALLKTCASSDVHKRLSENHAALLALETARDGYYLETVKAAEFREHYLKSVQNEGYYFSTGEIDIAAHLFNKRVTLCVKFGKLGYFGIPSGAENGDPVTILHQGNHFSRCEPVAKT